MCGADRCDVDMILRKSGHYANATVAIAGFGAEGRAAVDYFRTQGAVVTIFDERPLPPSSVPDGLTAHLREDAFASIVGFDVVSRSPSVRRDRIPPSNGRVTSVTKEFFNQSPAPVVGITGTKGKGTTASLIRSLLETAGRRVHLVGNIGVPAISILDAIGPTDLVVFELSSFSFGTWTRARPSPSF